LKFNNEDNFSTIEMKVTIFLDYYYRYNREAY